MIGSRLALASGLCLTLASAAMAAEMRLATIFSDDMLLQRDQPIRVWGTAAPDAPVEVTLAGHRVVGRADAEGRWLVELPMLKSGADLTLTAVSGAETVSRRNLIVGDVWLCGGQSNMEMQLRGCLGAAEDIRDAALPAIRHFKVPVSPSLFKEEYISSLGPWRPCSPQTAGEFTGVGFYFAREVQRRTGVPIGLLDVNYGGTLIEQWFSDSATQAYEPRMLKDAAYNTDLLLNTHFPKSLTAIDAWLALVRTALKDGRLVDADGQAKPPAGSVSVRDLAKLEQWVAAERNALKQHRFVDAAGRRLERPPVIAFVNARDNPLPPFPGIGWGGGWDCGSLYYGMVHALTRFPIKGVLWYQGESNGLSGRHDENPAYTRYAEKLRAFIPGWRAEWGIGDFPFYVVQLASWGKPNPDPAGGDGWAWIYTEQLTALSLPNTGLSVSIDLGHASNIHPGNKYDVGMRLARWALARDYGQKELVVSGPIYRGMRVEGSAIRIAFDHVGSGLMIGSKEGRESTKQVTDGRLRHFAIAGADRKWVWATAVIDGEAVVVSAPEVTAPMAVRYAYAQNPAGANLYNREGLPASPFRTDDWR